MIIPRYWIREAISFPYEGKTGEAGCWGWSENSEGEARQRSLAAGRRLADWLSQPDQTPPPEFAGWYGYDARPAREQVLEEFNDANGLPAAFVTRNRYGCLVLNTRDLVMVDADIPAASYGDGSLIGILKGLFGMTPTKSGRPVPPPEEEVLDKIRSWASQRPEVGMRLYRTSAGFRGLITNHLVDAATAEADSLLGSLPTDPLYRSLCKSQACYRARLTPKPWRIKIPAPQHHYPWPDGQSEDAFRQWLRGYEKAAEGFATCRLVETFGPDETLPELAPLLKLHDKVCGVTSERPLA